MVDVHLGYKKIAINICSILILISIISPEAYAGNTSIFIEGNQRCISSDGLPNHSTGTFPNSGNPGHIQQQNIRCCFALNPVKKQYPSVQRGSIGVALNGITIRPGTADYWDSTSQRGFSRNSSSGWNLEGLGSRELLGIDHNNAHVDNRGLYHYHGVANALVNATSEHGSLIGYAADGFEIHYVGSTQSSSYQLKQGYRPSGPSGRYDGTYNEDWEYVSGSSSLDQCNGGTLNNRFVYFATDTYPFFPRCLWGTASTDFGLQAKKTSRTQRTAPSIIGQQIHQHKQPSKGHSHRRQPPAFAISACSGKRSGSSCSMTTPRDILQGSCRQVPSSQLACVPSRPR